MDRATLAAPALLLALGRGRAVDPHERAVPGRRVFVEEDGRARSREVVVGQRNGSAAEILEGLSEGERVIVFPPDDVEDGASVRAMPR